MLSYLYAATKLMYMAANPVQIDVPHSVRDFIPYWKIILKYSLCEDLLPSGKHNIPFAAAVVLSYLRKWNLHILDIKQ